MPLGEQARVGGDDNDDAHDTESGEEGLYANPNHTVGEDQEGDVYTITLISFGYKHGPPGDTFHNFNIQEKVNGKSIVTQVIHIYLGTQPSKFSKKKTYWP